MSGVAAVLAAADDLDDLMRGCEMPDLGDRRDGFLHGGRGILVDPAAGLADQEGDDLVGTMTMQAGDIGVARGEPVDEALLDKKIERAIDRDGREAAPSGRRDPVGQVIGADRTVIGVQRFKSLGADRRQAQATLAADALGPCQGLGGMDAVVVRVTAAVSIMRGKLVMGGMRVVAMIVSVRLHFRHVALQRVIGQRGAVLSW
jgi:hypothetical protein